MSTPIQFVQAVGPQAQTQLTAAPKTQQAPAKTVTPQDTVNISESAKQALAGKNAGDVDHDGDNH